MAATPKSTTDRDLAKLIFVLASGYSFSSQLLSHHTIAQLLGLAATNPEAREFKGTYPPCAIPSMVVGAFSPELYFTCLIWRTIGPPPKKHSLDKLYGLLHKDQQSDIKTFFDAHMAANPLVMSGPEIAGSVFEKLDNRFESALTRLSDAFENWRYPYDVSAPMPVYSCDRSLIHALEQTILKLEPEWQKLLDARSSLPENMQLKPHA